jgi:tRNA-dihydrouridine synthase 1
MGENPATKASIETPNGTEIVQNGNDNKVVKDGKKKLHGRAFYESIGSPKVILAPMVDQSEYVSIGYRGVIFYILTPSRRGECFRGPSCLQSRAPRY